MSAAPLSRRNVELKARLADLERARAVARELPAENRGVLQQRDTYFDARHGRLKLREFEHRQAELIWYERANETVSRLSDYRLVPVRNPESLKAALTAAMGVLVVVEKRRELFLYRNVRIHLDTVTDLGTFLEFEAVLAPDDEQSAGEALLADLQDRFGIADSDLVAESYGDLLRRR